MYELHASEIKTDEQVILFPTNAVLETNADEWRIPVHGWIFEPDNDSLWRRAVVKSFIATLGLEPSALQSELLRQRLRMFLVDNERGKMLSIEMADGVFKTQKSLANGHFHTTALIPANTIGASPGARWLSLHVKTPEGDPRRFDGEVQLVGKQGLSVVSDIDDTIKRSNVLDKSELMRNTFLRPFVAVDGMSEAYRRWADEGATFHYVSASPWQLYPALSSFMDEAGFPRGSYHLKLFRAKDESFFNLFSSPLESKIPVIEALMRRYPQRRFILVGDSGEKDPEVYATLLRRHPQQVKHIFIRRLSNDVLSAARYQEAYAGTDIGKVTLFDDGAALAAESH